MTQWTSAEAQSRFYANEFPLVEVNSIYYAMPSASNSVLWSSARLSIYAGYAGRGNRASNMPNPTMSDPLIRFSHTKPFGFVVRKCSRAPISA